MKTRRAHFHIESTEYSMKTGQDYLYSSIMRRATKKLRGKGMKKIKFK